MDSEGSAEAAPKKTKKKKKRRMSLVGGILDRLNLTEVRRRGPALASDPEADRVVPRL